MIMFAGDTISMYDHALGHHLRGEIKRAECASRSSARSANFDRGRVVENGCRRPATGRDPVTAIRLSPEMRETDDQWAARQPDMPLRAEAIRRLVDLGLMMGSYNPYPARPRRVNLLP